MTGRGERGRDIARLIFVLSAMLVAFVASQVLFPPHFMGGGIQPSEWLTTRLGAALSVAGLAWMIRIVRSLDDVEAHPSFFRSQH